MYMYMYMYKHVKSLWVITLCTTAYAKVIGTYTVYDQVNKLMFLKLYPGFTHSSNYTYIYM